MIVLDSQHVDPLRTGSVKQQARKFISDYVEAGDAVAVVTVWEARALASEVHAGFVKLLADKYNYKGPVFCSMGEVLSVTGLEKHKADQEQTAGIDSRYPQGK